MRHFLIADDNHQVRRSFRGLLESQHHKCEEAKDIPEILRLVHKSQSNTEDANDFDLILMDFDFGDGTNGIQAINYLAKKFGGEYCEHRVIVITGATDRELPAEFARLGAIGHLIKPVNETQFWASIDSALTRRELYVEKREDWESAVKLLDNLGVLEGIEELNTYAQEYENLKTIHEQLLSDLQQAGGRDSQIASSYQYATEALNASPGNFQTIYSFLKSFGFTQKLISDAEDIFHSDRLQFVILQCYLQRIAASPQSYQIKHLAPGATNHYEYRVGRNFRLYFRKAVEGRIILERFGHKKIQPKIISYLDASADQDISQA